MPHERAYSPEEDASLKAALEACDRTKKIPAQLQPWCDDHGRSWYSVMKRLNKLGLSYAREKPVQEQREVRFDPSPLGHGTLQRGKKAGDPTITKAEAWTVHHTV